jgi:hypothetical protein
MSTEPGRSEQVIADFKQRRLARSAFHRIRDLLREFEEERAFDRRAAGFGVIAVVLLVDAALLLLLSGNSLTIN